MQAARSPFDIYTAADVRLLVEEYPLAWVNNAEGGEASLLPLIGIFDVDDQLVELIGHFARSNPLHADFKRDPRALIQFAGPHSYISPNQAGRRNWGPTWNYINLQVWADISVEEDLTGPALDVLIEHVESTQSAPWRAAELGPRYEVLVPHIIGFRAKVTRRKAKFKLGQDENPETLRSILSHLPDGDLARWMRRFNPGRWSQSEGEG